MPTASRGTVAGAGDLRTLRRPARAVRAVTCPARAPASGRGWGKEPGEDFGHGAVEHVLPVLVAGRPVPGTRRPGVRHRPLRPARRRRVDPDPRHREQLPVRRHRPQASRILEQARAMEWTPASTPGARASATHRDHDHSAQTLNSPPGPTRALLNYPENPSSRYSSKPVPYTVRVPVRTVRPFCRPSSVPAPATGRPRQYRAVPPGTGGHVASAPVPVHCHVFTVPVEQSRRHASSTAPAPPRLAALRAAVSLSSVWSCGAVVAG